MYWPVKKNFDIYVISMYTYFGGIYRCLAELGGGGGEWLTTAKTIQKATDNNKQSQYAQQNPCCSICATLEQTSLYLLKCMGGSNGTCHNTCVEITMLEYSQGSDASTCYNTLVKKLHLHLLNVCKQVMFAPVM